MRHRSLLGGRFGTVALYASAFAVIAFVVAMTVAACHDDQVIDDTASPQPTASPASDPTAVSDERVAACDPARPHEPGDSDRTLMSGDLERTYILHVPPGYDGVSPLPLVLNLHGYGSAAASQALYSRFPAKADEEGFIVVTPNGAGEPPHWNYPGLPGTDDIAFLGELLDAVDAELCIDASRVYSVGISNGAAFSSFVACAFPGRIAAIGAVAATALPRTCPDAPPIPVITFRGTADLCVPYEGGTAACGQRLPVAAAEEVARSWAERNGCNSLPFITRIADHVQVIAYSECDADVAVLLYKVEEGGHSWPGGIGVVRLGATNQEIDATDEIWQFFEAQANLR